MPQFLLFLRGDEVDWDGMTKEQSESHMQEFMDWIRSMHRSGQLVGVERLDRQIGGVVRRREGKVVLDGPFTEAKELVLGYFAVKVPDFDAAVEIARRCPTIRLGGSLEVRSTAPFPKID
jgi:hypothetical protein